MKTFIDVRVFNPEYAPSNRNSTLTQCYRKHKLEKKRAYEQRIREVEHASFTPIVYCQPVEVSLKVLHAVLFIKDLPQCGQRSGTSPIQQYHRLAQMHHLLQPAKKCSIQCIRGARSSKVKAARSVSLVDVVAAETNLIGHADRATMLYSFHYFIITCSLFIITLEKKCQSLYNKT